MDLGNRNGYNFFGSANLEKKEVKSKKEKRS